jgi:hypothetical protein
MRLGQDTREPPLPPAPGQVNEKKEKMRRRPFFCKNKQRRKKIQERRFNCFLKTLGK